MNLGDAKRRYQQVLATARTAALSEGLSGGQVADIELRLDSIHKDAKRGIDQYTTRRFLSVNQRSGLVGKLERLHRQAHAELRRIVAERPPSDP